MKNIVLKICSIFILLIVIIFPLSALSSRVEIPVESITIVQESLTIVEEETTTEIKMITTFEDKLEMIQVRTDRVPEKSTTQSVIEEKTTRQAKTQTPSTTQTTTETTITTTEVEVEIELIVEAIEDIAEIEEEMAIVSSYSGEYAAATQVWNYLHSIGCNDYASAGILGNMMSECGGHTLELQWWIYGGGYYGLCQWYYEYFPSVQGADLTTQLEFLGSSLPKTMNTYGYMYTAGFNYNSFANINDIEAAAIAFAKCYERCASWSYSSRVNNAYKAYRYFCS